MGSRERTRCSRRQSPPSSPSRASGTQLVGEGGGEGETETGESRGPGLREGEMLRRGAHPFSHTRCTRKSRMVPRAALVSPGAPRGGGGVRSRAGPRSPTSRSARLGSHDQSAQSRLGLPRSGSLFKAMGSALLLPSLLFRFFFHPPPFSSQTYTPTPLHTHSVRLCSNLFTDLRFGFSNKMMTSLLLH